MKFLARLFGGKGEADPERVEAAPGTPVPTWSAQPPAMPAPASPVEKLPYRLNDKFLTRAEASFFRVLQLALPDGVLLCPKVNLQDLFWAPPHDYPARNRIDRKHVDFVLADGQTLRPLCGIELDDRSHQRPDRQERDRFVEAVFAAAGLPLLRVPVSAEYDPRELATGLRAAIAEAPKTSRAAKGSPANGSVAAQALPPACPNCRTPMVVRTAKSGAKAGQQFYGCPNYPRCHGMVML